MYVDRLPKTVLIGNPSEAKRETGRTSNDMGQVNTIRFRGCRSFLEGSED
jgi:hypothetical protein